MSLVLVNIFKLHTVQFTGVDYRPECSTNNFNIFP